LVLLEDLNHFDQKRFVDAIGWVFEHSPWVAERAWGQRPFASLDELAAALNGEVETAALDEQWALLRAHPDLGTRAKVSPGSEAEQSGAGLDSLTHEEYDKLLRLNTGYRQKFGFPFLYAVRGSDKTAIFNALRTRTRSSKEAEFREALDQVYRIARFRLEDTIKVKGD
jgi:OHCU decarboxylase